MKSLGSTLLDSEDFKHNSVEIVIINPKVPLIKQNSMKIQKHRGYFNSGSSAQGAESGRLLKEASSYDTIGNGYFAMTIHAIPANWRCALVHVSAAVSRVKTPYPGLCCYMLHAGCFLPTEGVRVS